MNDLTQREYLRTTDEEIALDFGRILELFRLALAHAGNTQRFCLRMNEGSGDGLNWIEALEQTAGNKGKHVKG